MATRRILLPYNFTRLDQKALEFVINTFGKMPDASVTVFNAYTPIPEIDTNAATVTGRLKGNLTYLFQNIMENEKVLNTVKAKIVEAGIPENRVDCLFRPRKKDIAAEIIDLAIENGFDIIVLNRKHARVTRFFSGSTSYKVMIGLKDITICIVS